MAEVVRRVLTGLVVVPSIFSCLVYYPMTFLLGHCIFSAASIYLGAKEFYTLAPMIEPIPSSTLVMLIHNFAALIATYFGPVLGLYTGLIACFAVRLSQLETSAKQLQRSVMFAILFDLFYIVVVDLPISYALRLPFLK